MVNKSIYFSWYCAKNWICLEFLKAQFTPHFPLLNFDTIKTQQAPLCLVFTWCSEMPMLCDKGDSTYWSHSYYQVNESIQTINLFQSRVLKGKNLPLLRVLNPFIDIPSTIFFNNFHQPEYYFNKNIISIARI